MEVNPCMHGGSMVGSSMEVNPCMHGGSMVGSWR